MRVHVTNLGPRGRRRRLVLGVAMLAAGAAVAGALLAAGAGTGWLLLTWPPFWAGALGLIQAREGT